MIFISPTFCPKHRWNHPTTLAGTRLLLCGWPAVSRSGRFSTSSLRCAWSDSREYLLHPPSQGLHRKKTIHDRKFFFTRNPRNIVKLSSSPSSGALACTPIPEFLDMLFVDGDFLKWSINPHLPMAPPKSDLLVFPKYINSGRVV